MQPRPAMRILAFTGKHTGKFLWYGMFGMPALHKYHVSVKIFFQVWGVLGWDKKEWKGAKSLE